ncbi:MAG TPA: hypothetical protein VGM20_00245 [Gemmatimonadales bacterium]|jgi:hypothetical protein
MRAISPNSLVVCAAAGAVILFAGNARAQVALDPHFPLHIASASFQTDSDRVGNLLDGAIGRDGRICAADFSEKMIHCLVRNPDHWVEIGRNGEGPGEFRAPYRVAFTPSQAMWVWDFQSQQLSHFDAAGHFTGRAALPYFFRQVDNMVALGEDRVVFCGVTSIASPARDSALHLFKWVGSGTPMQLVRAFGRLPAYSVREKIDHWGAGVVTVAANGNLYYTRRVPWDISEFRLDGTLVRVIPGPETLIMGADSAVSITEDKETVTIRRNPDATIVYPLRAIDIGQNWILTGRRIATPKEAHVVWDLLDRRTGRRIAETPLPKPLTEISGFGYDATRNTLWASGSRDDVDGIWSVTFARTPQ